MIFILKLIADMNIQTLQPSEVLKSTTVESNPRGTTRKRTRSKSIVPDLENIVVLSQDLKIIKR